MRTSADRLESAATQIESFLRTRFRIAADDTGFTRTVNLWEEGYVDSVGVVEVIEFLEHTFAVRIPDDALFSPDFTCVEGMAGFVTHSLEPRRPLSVESRQEHLSPMEERHQGGVARVREHQRSSS